MNGKHVQDVVRVESIVQDVVRVESIVQDVVRELEALFRMW